MQRGQIFSGARSETAMKENGYLHFVGLMLSKSLRFASNPSPIPSNERVWYQQEGVLHDSVC